MSFVCFLYTAAHTFKTLITKQKNDVYNSNYLIKTWNNYVTNTRAENRDDVGRLQRVDYKKGRGMGRGGRHKRIEPSQTKTISGTGADRKFSNVFPLFRFVLKIVRFDRRPGRTPLSSWNGRRPIRRPQLKTFPPKPKSFRKSALFACPRTVPSITARHDVSPERRARLQQSIDRSEHPGINRGCSAVPAKTFSTAVDISDAFRPPTTKHESRSPVETDDFQYGSNSGSSISILGVCVSELYVSDAGKIVFFCFVFSRNKNTITLPLIVYAVL